jgi:hypothetical protein
VRDDGRVNAIAAEIKLDEAATRELDESLRGELVRRGDPGYNQNIPPK